MPVEDMALLGQPTGEVSGSAAGAEQRTSIWPSVEARVLELVRAHRSTIVFANSRRLAGRLTARHRLSPACGASLDQHAAELGALIGALR